MPEGLLHLFVRRPLGEVVTDVIDLLIVTYVLYRALLVLRGTRAMQMGTGLLLIFLIYIAAKQLALVTLLSLLSTLLSSIILIVVVVFQNDIRRGLMRVGSRAFLGGFARAQESRVIDEVVAAATELARHRMGALIAFEQDANLDEFVVAQGIPVDSAVTRELMVSLFVPESVNKLHDGAVIIRNLRIAKAGVFFPMPESRIVDTSLGSRHRAALGITEETDAVVVVVSEERGTISFCFSGNIVSNLDGASLRQALLGLFGRKPRKKGTAKKVATPGPRASYASLASRVSAAPTPGPGAVGPVAEGPTPSPLGNVVTTSTGSSRPPPPPRPPAGGEHDRPLIPPSVAGEPDRQLLPPPAGGEHDRPLLRPPPATPAIVSPSSRPPPLLRSTPRGSGPMSGRDETEPPETTESTELPESPAPKGSGASSPEEANE